MWDEMLAMETSNVTAYSTELKVASFSSDLIGLVYNRTIRQNTEKYVCVLRTF